jgi:hypothetical protein
MKAQEVTGEYKEGNYLHIYIYMYMYIYKERERERQRGEREIEPCYVAKSLSP